MRIGEWAAGRRPGRVLGVAAALVLWLFWSTAMAGYVEPSIRSGYVFSGGPVTGAGGQPVFAEFDQRGNLLSIIGEASGGYADAKVMPADSYRAAVTAYQGWLAQNGGGAGLGAELLGRDEYLERSLTTVGGETMAKPPLQVATRSVLVLGAAKRVSVVQNPILWESPIDLRRIDSRVNDGAIRSLLMSRDGRVLYASSRRIGYRTAYFEPQSADGSDDQRLDHQADELPLHPVAGVKVTTDIRPEAQGVSDETGHYGLGYYLPPCPGFVINYPHQLVAEIPYFEFNPRSGRPWGVYRQVRKVNDFCNGIGALMDMMPGNSPVGLAERIALADLATVDVRVHEWTDFVIEALAVEGSGRLGNPGSPVASGETRYAAAPAPTVPGVPANLDLDRDGLVDVTVPLEDGQVAVYLGGRQPQDEQGNPQPPDLVRLADVALDFGDQGLLESVSDADLEETDLYVFRQADGRLLAEARGGKALGGGDFQFAFMLRGPNWYDYFTGGDDYDIYTSTVQMEAGLQSIGNDHLRPGEPLRVVAINRATGYLGSVELTVPQSWTVLYVPGITLFPPRLKVWAERDYTVAEGVTGGERRHYLIGSEGAGLTSDAVVALHTEWLDWDGGELPAGLPGYTGRLARAVAPQTLGPVGGAAQFEVRPGRQLQWLRLPQVGVDDEHYYLHLAGAPPERSPDLSSVGAGGGALAWRPAHYVPVQVPLLDEAATREARNQAAYARQDGATVGEVEAIYRWPYRPEYQFSLYDLEIAAIRRADALGEVRQLTPGGTEEVPVVSTGDAWLELVYGLTGSEVAPLTPIGPGQELVLALGASEVRATVGEEGTVRFTDLAHLAALDPYDLLALQLTVGSDAENVLWEYAFAVVEAAPGSAFVSADDPRLELLVQVPGGGEGEATLRWLVEGPGGSLDEAATTSGIGIFTNTLNLSNRAGDRFYVTVEAISSDDPRIPLGTRKRFGPFEVVPGRAARIELGSDSRTLPADTLSATTLQATVYDAYDNRVADGTPVSWQLDYDGELETLVGETVDGVVATRYVVGDRTGATDVVAAAGTAKLAFTLEKEPLTATLEVDRTTLGVGSGMAATVTLHTSARDGTPVVWNTTRGRLLEEQTVVAGGVARAVIGAGDRPGEGIVTASLGTHEESLRIRHVAAPGQVVAEFGLAAVVDAPADGQVTVDGLRGPGTHHYPTHSYATLTGLPGSQVSVAPGGFFTPNAEPGLLLAMNGVETAEDGIPRVSDEQGGSGATLFGAVSMDDTESFTAPGSSLRFDGGHLNIAAGLGREAGEGLFLNLRFRVDPAGLAEGEEEALLAYQGDGTEESWSLRLTDNGTRLEGRVATTEGSYVARMALPVEPGVWHLAGLRLREGRLELGLDGERVAVPAAGTPVAVDGDLALGSAAFRGHLDDFELGRERAETALLTFGDGSLSRTVTFGEDGTALVEVQAHGRGATRGQVIGLSVQELGASAQAEQGWRDAMVVGAARMLGIGVAYANPEAGAQEAGVALVKDVEWGVVAEWAGKKVFGEHFGAVKETAEFLYQLTAISDVVTLLKAVYALAQGDTEGIDGLEVTFAALGIGATVLGAVAGGPVGVVTLKEGLRGAKPVLKALFDTGATEALKTAVLIGKYMWRQVRAVIKEPRRVLAEGAGFARGLVAAVSDVTGRSLEYLFRTVKSLRHLDDWVEMRKLDEVCLLAERAGPVRYADLTPEGEVFFRTVVAGAVLEALFGREAQAAGCGGFTPDGKIASIALDTAKYGSRAAEIGIAVRRTVVTLEKGGIVLQSEKSLEVLADIANARGAAHIELFAEKAVAGFPQGVYHLTVRAPGLERMLEDIAVVDSAVRGYDRWIKKMVEGMFAVKGIAGEAQGIGKVMERYQGRNLRLLEVSDKIDEPFENYAGVVVSRNKEGVDAIFELDGGRKLFMESKVISSATTRSDEEIIERLGNQFFKHLETRALKEVELGVGKVIRFKGEMAPIVDYHLAGGWFTLERKAKILVKFQEVMKDPRLRSLMKAEPGFVFDERNLIDGEIVESIIK